MPKGGTSPLPYSGAGSGGVIANPHPYDTGPSSPDTGSVAANAARGAHPFGQSSWNSPQPAGSTGGGSGQLMDLYGQMADKDAATQRELLNQQTIANRPDVNTPWASQKWNVDQNGNWTQGVALDGFLGSASNDLQGRVADYAHNPFDFSQFGKAGTGDEARNQAIDSAYKQSTSRLDPQWQQREDQTRTMLLNQGLTPGTEAFNQAMSSMGRERNDAYSSAMSGAIGQGTAAGDSAFRNNMTSRQQSIQEALMGRAMPMQELQQLRGFTDMPGSQGASMGGAPNYLNAAIAGQNANMQGQQMNASNNSAFMQFLASIGMIGATAASDARVKDNIRPLGFDAMPGVPFVTWTWKPEFSADRRRQAGVLAQDLEKVAPKYVSARADGLKLVDYGFLRKAR